MVFFAPITPNFGESGMTLTLSAEYFYDDRFDPTVYATSVAPERFQRSAIQTDIDNSVLDINDVVVTSTDQFVYDNNPNTEWLDTEQLQNLNQQIDQNNIAIGSGAQQDQISGLLLAANIGYSESAFITVRYSNTKTEFTNANHLGTNQDLNINDPVNLSIAVPDIKVSKWTLAHVSALADDLSLILEVSDEKVSGAYNTTTNTRPDETSLFTAFEILYTF